MLWRQRLSKLVDKAKFFCLDILFPITCVGCGQETDWICQSCRVDLCPNLFQYCPACGARNLSGEACIACATNSFLDALFICFDYSNQNIKKLIINFKYKGAFEIKRLFIDWLIDLLYTVLIPNIEIDKMGDIIVIPVPLHRRRFIQRGFNQAELLALGIASHFSMPVKLNVLYRGINTISQAELSIEDRKTNIQNAFFIKNHSQVVGKRVVLVDDVFTSGSTMEECAKALKASGASAIYGIVVAKG